MKKAKKRRKNIDKDTHCDNTFHIYLEEINRIPLLSREEEDKIARAAAMGDSAARERLINSNLRFVVKVAKRYKSLRIPLEDLVNEGNIGLMDAVERFDVERGYRFITYAVWWIRQAILKALYQKARFIRLPENKTNDLIHIERMKKLYAPSEIAEILNIKENYMKDVLAISREVVSLEKMVNTGSGSLSLVNIVEDDRYNTPDEMAINSVLEDDIKQMLENLDCKEAEVIRMHYGLGEWPPMTLKEIAEQFNLSKERVRQIEEKALTRLRHLSRKNKLGAYVA